MKDKETPEVLVKNIVKRLIAGMIYHPKDLRVKIVTCGTIMEVGIDVHEHDVRLVIGSLGQNMSAIGRICKEFGHYFERRVVVDLHAPEKKPGVVFDVAPFQLNGNWDAKEMIELIGDVFALMGWETIRIRKRKKVNTTILLIDHAYQDIPRDLQLALQVAFHAIGKASGARVHREFPSEHEQREKVTEKAGTKAD